MKHASISLIALSLLSPAVVLAAPDKDISAEEYTRQLKAAKVWHATDVESFDMIEGVAGPKELLSTRGPSGELIKPTVHCAFKEPESSAVGGKSAKFECKALGKIEGKESKKLKVKYDPAELLPPSDPLLPPQGYNGEVYSELAASRLLTALGFKTDRMFPVTLVCHNCPREPHTYITRPELRETMGRVEELVLERAAIEIKAEGEELGSPRLDAEGGVVKDEFGEAIYDHVGWGLDQIRSGPAAAEDPAEQTSREALVALLGILQHADNKASNQRLLCTDWDKKDKSCLESYLVPQDLGSLLGKGVDITGDLLRGRRPLMTKFDWSQWDSVRVWKGLGVNCQLKVNTIPSLGGRLPIVENTFRNKVISVEARDFLLRLLERLSDKQLADVFVVAQTDERDEQVRSGFSALASLEEAPFYGLDPRILRIGLDRIRPARSPVHAIGGNVQLIRDLRTVIKSTQPDVVISFLHQMNVQTLIAARGTGIPVIVTEHTDPNLANRHPAWDRLRAVLYPHAAAIVVLSESSKQFFSPSLQDRIKIIPNPIVVEPGLEARPDDDRKQVIAVGRFGPEKGFDVLIDAFAQLAPQFPDWDLEIWGDGILRPDLEAQRDRLKLTDRIRMPGKTSRPHQVLRGADLYVLSSRREGFPMALAEAMACGLPAVAFNLPSGPRDIIRDGIDGVLVPDQDADSLRDAMSRLMTDDGLRHRMAAEAPDVIDRFGVEPVMAVWADLLVEVLEKQ